MNTFVEDTTKKNVREALQLYTLLHVWQRWNQWRPPPKTESGRQKRRSNDGRGVEMQRQDAAHATEEWTHPSFVNEKNLYYGTLRKFDFELILTFPLKFLAHAQWDAVLHGRLELALNQ